MAETFSSTKCLGRRRFKAFYGRVVLPSVSTTALLAGLSLLSSGSIGRLPGGPLDPLDPPTKPQPRGTLHIAVEHPRTHLRIQDARIDAVHPAPVVGRLRTLGSQCFADNTGCRTFSIAHQGDLAARYVWGCARGDARSPVQINRPACHNEPARCNSSICRTWWRFDDVPGSPWFTTMYPGFEPSTIPEFLRCGAELIRYAGSLRPSHHRRPYGGIDKLGKHEELQLFGLYRQLIDAGGHDNIAWVEALNEPSSVHATSDGDGDNQPAHLSDLLRSVLNGTNVLGHLGHADNSNYRETGRYTPSWQRYNYVHGSRAGNVFDRISRRFTWGREFAEETGLVNGRLTIDGESVGWPVGLGLQRVSDTTNGHEMNDPEALALIALATAVRGIPSHMSGTGIQRFEPFTNTVGWREIPWAVSQLPKDVATFSLVHGGQVHDSRVVIEATTNAAGILGRAGSGGRPQWRTRRPSLQPSSEPRAAIQVPTGGGVQAVRRRPDDVRDSQRACRRLARHGRDALGSIAHQACTLISRVPGDARPLIGARTGRPDARRLGLKR